MSTFTTEDRMNAQQQPLSHEKIAEIATHCMVPMFHTSFKADNEVNDHMADALTQALRQPIYDFARAVEEAHGIK